MKHKCEKCNHKPFKSEMALHVHESHMHRRQVRKPIKNGAVLCQINFCPHCGRQLPNAIVRQRI